MPPSLQLTLTDPAMGETLAELAQRLHQANLTIARLKYLQPAPKEAATTSPASAGEVLEAAYQLRTLCAAALLLYLPNQHRAIVGHDDEVGKWEIQREHGNHVTARPYREDEWESLDGDSLSDYQDAE